MQFFFSLAVTIMRKKPFLNPLFFSPPLILFLLCCVILLPCHTRWVCCNPVIWILTWHDALLHKLLPSPPLLQTQLEDCVEKKKEQRDKQVRIEPSENFAKLPRSWYHKKKNPSVFKIKQSTYYFSTPEGLILKPVHHHRHPIHFLYGF